MRFSPQVQGNRNFAPYDTVKEAVVTHIQKTFKGGHDVSKSLKDMALVDYATAPTRRISTLADPACIQEQKGFDMDYNSASKRFYDKKELLEDNMFKAYSLIKDNYCTKTMQQRLEEMPNYETSIDDDPIALLTAIQLLLHDPVRAQFPTVSMFNALKAMVTIRQYEGESLLDYSKRLKQTRNIMYAHQGEGITDGFVMMQPEYVSETDMAVRAEMKKKASKAFIAYIFLQGSDPTKYGSLLEGFQSQYSMGTDQYPRTLEVALDVLSNHKFDSRYFEIQKRDRDQRQKKEKEQPQEAKKEESLTTSFVQNKDGKGLRLCFVCGDPGHLSPDCPDKGKPREQWFSYKTMQHMMDGICQPTDADDDVDNGADDESDTKSTNSHTNGGHKDNSATQYRSFTRAADGTISWSM